MQASSSAFSSSSTSCSPCPPPRLRLFHLHFHLAPPPLPPCQPCQLVAKLCANCPAQCALLDVNLRAAQLSVHRWTSSLRAAQLSVHRWTSTGDLPSSVCTAGPQPGTFPAQCAPLDLNLGPTGTCPAQYAPLDLNLGPAQLSVHRWTSTAR